MLAALAVLGLLAVIVAVHASRTPHRRPNGAVPPRAQGVPTGVPGSWRLVFHDEFSSPVLDGRVWQPGWFGTGITAPVHSFELQCYDSAQVRPVDGVLHLRTVTHSHSCGGRLRRYASAMVSSNPAERAPGRGWQFRYGLVEARVDVPSTSDGRCANWPAVWTVGQRWPRDGEIDVMECLGGSVAWHLWSGPDGGAADGPGHSVPGSWTGWHTFAADWEPGSVTFYYDGRQVGQHAYHVSSPQYLVLNVALSDPARAVVPSDVRVDYMRVWQH